MGAYGTIRTQLKKRSRTQLKIEKFSKKSWNIFENFLKKRVEKNKEKASEME